MGENIELLFADRPKVLTGNLRSIAPRIVGNYFCAVYEKGRARAAQEANEEISRLENTFKAGSPKGKGIGLSHQSWPREFISTDQVEEYFGLCRGFVEELERLFVVKFLIA